MKNIKILLCLVAIVPFVALAQPVSAATRLSGISVQSACVHQYGQPIYASLAGKTVINWLCVAKYSGSNVIYKYGVDLNRECRRIYGRSAYAAYTSFYNPYSWGCYR